MPVPKLTLIVPAYNERGRIVETLERVRAYFDSCEFTVEIVVVDDGSTDDTAEVVRAANLEAVVVGYAENRGKGYASREGLRAATGEYALIYDADGSTPIEEVSKLWPAFDSGADVVIGSRALPASEVRVPQPRHRRLMGRVYNRLLQALGLTTMRDTQCGFKGLSRKAIDIILPRLVSEGFGADCEMLAIATAHRLKVVEIPIIWINSNDTRVKPIAHSLEMFLEVLRIRVRLSLGRYA